LFGGIFGSERTGTAEVKRPVTMLRQALREQAATNGFAVK
jgi:hypothetical protein